MDTAQRCGATLFSGAVPRAIAPAVFSLCFILTPSIFCQTSTPEPPLATDAQPAQTQPPAETPDGHKPDHALTPWEMLADGTTQHTVARRQEAVAALCTLGSRPRAIELVEATLADKDPSVRQLAARSLGQMKAKAAISRLKDVLNDDAIAVRFAAAKSLWDMGDRTGRDVFISILSGEESNSSGMVKDQLETAKKRLQDPRGLAIIGAKETATSLFGPAGWGIMLMEEVTRDRTASARAMSATALGHDANQDALRELDEALWDKNWLVRAASAQALGDTRQHDQIKHLKALLWDAKPAVRYMAAASIIRLSSAKPAMAPGSTLKSPGTAAALQTPTSSR
jgi:hypothetical protein